MDYNPAHKRQKSPRASHDDWDEVHNQLLEVQGKQRVQKKSLEISSAGDADEKEADEVARKVTNGASAEIHGSGGMVNRKGTANAEATPQFQSQLEQSKGDGQSLPGNVQQEMGSKMGTDFTDVKIHTNSNAHQMSESINAQAFTHGKDVFFGKNMFDPNSKAGKELLAHELVHTEQQTNKVSRKIIVGGEETPASSILPLVTTDINTWYPAIVAGVQAKVAGFTAADMPFTIEDAVTRGGDILTEMQDAQFLKATTSSGSGKKKGKHSSTTGMVFETTYKREKYDFNFETAQDASDEVIFRLALIVNMHLANLDKTRFARYPGAGETGFNLQNPAVWSPVETPPTGKPGGFTLQPGTLPATAIIQLTTPPADVNQRIVVDCSTMMGILLYESLAGTTQTEQDTFNTQFKRNLTVGPLPALYGPMKASHPLMGTANPAKSPYMKPVDISRLEDLVPGDVISFGNYREYGKLEPGGLWNGEWATYTKKVNGVMYFEGFGVSENTYDYFIQEMQNAYDAAWDNSTNPFKGNKLTTESSEDTIERKLPGISRKVLRIDLAAYNQT